MANTNRGYPNEQTGYPNRLDQDFKIVTNSTTAFEVWRDDGLRYFAIDTATPSFIVGSTVTFALGATTISSTSANAFTVGPNATPTTNPTFNIDASTASAITGLNVKSAASGSGITLASLGGTNENIIFAPKGTTSGVVINQNSALAFVVTPAANLSNPVLSVDTSVTSQADGLLIQGQATTIGVNLQAISNGATSPLLLDAKAGAAVKIGSVASTALGLIVGSAGSIATTVVTVLSSNASALAVGRLGATTPALQVDASTATSITGLLVKSAATGNGVALKAQGAAAEPITIDAATTGIIAIGSTSTGIVAVGRGARKVQVNGLTLVALGTTQNTTPTAAQIVGGVLTQTSATGAGTCTLDNGTNISAAISGVAVGDTFTCQYQNLGGGFTVTITGATGSTVIGTAAVPSGKGATMTFYNTGANAWNVYCVVSA